MKNPTRRETGTPVLDRAALERIRGGAPEMKGGQDGMAAAKN